jgi:nucleoside-diphosphate-sugar epimerase
MSNVHVIFGFGPVGRTLATRLVAAGKEVRIVSRRPIQLAGATHVGLDASETANAIEASKGAAVIYNCVNADITRWLELLPPLYESMLSAAVQHHAKYVVMDNLYMYGPVKGPMVEDLPYRPNGPKSTLRGKLAEDILRSHAEGKVEAVLVRASDFFGPYVENALISRSTLLAMKAGKRFPTIGNLDAKHTFSYMPDVAAALEICGENPLAIGKVWHVPSLPAISVRGFLKNFGNEFGVTPKPMNANRFMLNILGVFNPMMKSLKETLYQWESDYVMDSTQFQTTFGLQPTPMKLAVQETIRSL